MKIAVIGTGYVGLSNAVLLSQNHEVVALDVIKEKVVLINCKKSPILDYEIQDFLTNKKLNLRASLDKEDVYINANYVIIATPTNYDPNLNFFDTSSVDATIADVKKYNPSATIIIKSTVPVGYTRDKQLEYPTLKNYLFP